MRESQKTNIKHLENPRIGDTWHEMYAVICRVIGVTDDSVTYLNAIYNEDGGYLDGDNPVTMNREDFKNKLLYSARKDATWADVIPEKLSTLEIEYEV